MLPHLANAQDAACRDAPVYRALDFWLGDWRVTSSDGDEQGRNRINASLDGCAVLENWNGAAIRFHWEITPPGGNYLDRTRSSPLDGGAVRQLIETSSDGDASWQVTFAGICRRE